LCKLWKYRPCFLWCFLSGFCKRSSRINNYKKKDEGNQYFSHTFSIVFRTNAPVSGLPRRGKVRLDRFDGRAGFARTSGRPLTGAMGARSAAIRFLRKKIAFQPTYFTGVRRALSSAMPVLNRFLIHHGYPPASLLCFSQCHLFLVFSSVRSCQLRVILYMPRSRISSSFCGC